MKRKWKWTGFSIHSNNNIPKGGLQKKQNKQQPVSPAQLSAVKNQPRNPYTHRKRRFYFYTCICYCTRWCFHWHVIHSNLIYFIPESSLCISSGWICWPFCTHHVHLALAANRNWRWIFIFLLLLLLFFGSCLTITSLQ